MSNPRTLLFPPGGMPSVPRKGPPDPRESVKISSELMDKLRDIAQCEGRFIGHVLERLIRVGLKAEGFEND